MAFKSTEIINDSDDELDAQFDIPPGFNAVSKDAVVKSSNEQVWLIQIPSSLPLEKLKELSAKEFSIDAKRFIIEDSNENLDKKRLKLITNGKISNAKVSRCLKIRQTAHIPSIDIEKVAISKPIVPQRENLIMRYQATGYEDAGGRDAGERDAGGTSIEIKKSKIKSENQEKTHKEHSKEKKHKSKKRSKEDGDDKKHKKKKKRSNDEDID